MSLNKNRPGDDRNAEQATAPEVVEYTEVNDSLQDWFRKNGRMLAMVLGGLLLLVVGWVAYQNFVKKPRDISANDTVLPSELLFSQMVSGGFSKDSVAILLNGGNLGGENIPGLLKFINNNGGTAAANRARYMVGASYLHIGDFDKAINFLEDFNANGASQVESRREVMLGHAYAEKKQADKALAHYKSAAAAVPNDMALASDALIMAGQYAVVSGKNDEAIKIFKDLKEKYPLTQFVQSGNVDKELARLGEFSK